MQEGGPDTLTICTKICEGDDDISINKIIARIMDPSLLAAELQVICVYLQIYVCETALRRECVRV
jgi:hypothetical protein